MGNLLDAFENFQRRWREESKLPLRHLVTKSCRLIQEFASAPINLRAINELGRGTRTHRRPRIDNQGFMAIGRRTIVHSMNTPVYLATAPGARLLIGERCFINYGTSIIANQHIEVGHRVLIGPYVSICDASSPEAEALTLNQGVRAVIVEDDVWIGAKATIMAGVRIGRGAIVGVSAVVTEDVPAFTVVAGQPARVIKKLDPTRFVQSS